MLVVIIDDSKVNVALIQALVRRLGDCESKGFTEAPQALEWCRDNDMDLVVVDYMMPDLNGMQFIEAFRQFDGKADVPVLMITAATETEILYSALQRGATDFLNKPVDQTEFLARSRNMLTLRRNQKALADRASWLAEEVRKATAVIVQRERETVHRLSRAAEYRDPETGAHILRMAHYSRLIAQSLGLSTEQQELILTAAPMHDIGKVGIPDHILLKPGRLDPDELVIMRTHAEIGYIILEGSTSPVIQAAAVIARSHHEKWDGSGYPQGLAGEDIPLLGRIVAVADVFDALTSERPYKKAWEIDRAEEFLRSNAGSHFDEACVNAFFAAWNDVLEIQRRYQD